VCGIAEGRRVEGHGEGGLEAIHKGRQVLQTGTVDGFQSRQFDPGQRLAEPRGELVSDAGEIGGHQPAAAGEGLHQNQRQSFVE
jgi:hypothetical protein